MKVQELFIQLDKTKRESGAQIQTYKQKSSEYKLKVKQANMQINMLVNKLAQLGGAPPDSNQIQSSP